MTMPLRVFIIDELCRATPSELAVLEEITAAKLEQHLADRAKYMRPQTDAASSAGNMVEGSSPPVRANSHLSAAGGIPHGTLRDAYGTDGSGARAPRGQEVPPPETTGLSNRATSQPHPVAGTNSGTGVDSPPVDTVEAGNPLPAKPALSTMPPARVAWDLTLRCPDCGSHVEGTRSDYTCLNQRCAIGAEQGRAFVASRGGR